MSQEVHQEDEILGKAYDARLMARILRYLRPYWKLLAISFLFLMLQTGSQLLGPYITKVAIDRYLRHVPGTVSVIDRFLSADPLTGLSQIAGLYFLTLLMAFNYAGRDYLLYAIRALAHRVRSGDLEPEQLSEAHVVGSLYS